MTESLGQRRQPTLGLPLERVVTPERLVRVACLYTQKDVRSLGYGYLRDHLSVDSLDGLRERQNCVLECSAGDNINELHTDTLMATYSLNVIVTAG